jgi:hypothetical protein
MSERVTKWEPVSDIDSPFGSISYSFHDDVAQVHMIGARILVLRFVGVVTLRFEQECPSFDFPAVELLPMLRPSQTFPLLLVAGSKLLEQFSPTYGRLSHFGMVSGGHLLQILAKPTVEAYWKDSNETSNQAMEPTANRPYA